METTNHKIIELKLKNFTCFEDISMEFCSGVNVIIGENGTGKTHILKVLYAFLLSKREYPLTGGEKIDDYMPKILGSSSWDSLTRNSEDTQNANIEKPFFELKYQSGDDIFSLVSLGTGGFHADDNENRPSIVYIPPNEMLSFNDGFRASYENRELDFDYSYYELSKALGLNKLRNGLRKSEADELKTVLLELVYAEVVKEGNAFYHQYSEDFKLSSKMAADGENKIAQIIYLIENGTINKNTLLLWDEPEVSLNPKWTSVVAKFLISLAQMGIQSVIATHDYLLSNRLSLYDERQELQNDEANPEIKFFCLNKNEQNATEILSGRNLTAIDRNPILEEFLKFYEEEETLVL